MNLTKLFVLGFLMSLAQASFADREFADIYTDCGLGAMIAPNNDAVAAVTNVTFDLGTTAISSNASSEDTCAGGGATSAAFIYQAYPTLEQDLAKGEGDHLSALVTMMSCDAGASGAISAALRAEFATWVNDDDFDTKTQYENAEAVYGMMNRVLESNVATSCALS